MRRLEFVWAVALWGCLGDATEGPCAHGACVEDADVKADVGRVSEPDSAVAAAPDAAVVDAASQPHDAVVDACVPPAPVVQEFQRLVPGGGFQMGDSAGGGANEDNQPHPATVDHGLVVQVREVTRLDWLRTFNSQIALPHPELGNRPNAPLTGLSWFAALQYANARSMLDGLMPCYRITGCEGTLDAPQYTCSGLAFAADCDGWRLPTEVEWEYAARAGGSYDPDPTAEGFSAANSGGMVQNVGGLPTSHAWGLRDVLGNAAEWTFDCYGIHLGLESGPCDPVDPQNAEKTDRVVRGGSYLDTSLSLSMRRPVGARLEAPSTAANDVGFRLVRTPRGCGLACELHGGASGTFTGRGLGFLSPVQTFNYSSDLPYIQGVGALENFVLAAVSVGDGTLNDTIRLRLLDLNADTPVSDQADRVVHDYQPSEKTLPLPLRVTGAAHPEFAVVSSQKYDECHDKGHCTTFVQRIDPHRPLSEALPAQALFEYAGFVSPAFNLEAAGLEDTFVVATGTFSDVEPSVLGARAFQMTAEGIVPAATWADAPDGRVIETAPCIGSIGGASTPLGGGRILLVTGRPGRCGPNYEAAPMQVWLTVTDLAGRSVGLPSRLLALGEFRAMQATAPLLVHGAKLFVVVHDSTIRAPSLYRFDLPTILAGGEVVADAGFPKLLFETTAEVENFNATSTALHVGLQVAGAPNWQTVAYGRLDFDGHWLSEPWTYLPSQGWGAARGLPDGRAIVLGSGYWDHRIYAGVLGCE